MTTSIQDIRKAINLLNKNKVDEKSMLLPIEKGSFLYRALERIPKDLKLKGRRWKKIFHESWDAEEKE